jgi:methionine sulfoxide reductase heme-binding subunit
MALWHDKRGRFSLLRALTLPVLVAPVIALIYFALFGDLGARPRTEAIHEVGLWGLRFLMASLFVTPLRRIARYAPLIDVRRMIGVASFLYMILHLVLYIADEVYDIRVVVSEIVLRIYLTIGFTGWLGMMVLGATSNDYMVRQLGGLRWRSLHRLVYPIMILGCIHYFMQSKLEVFEPTWIAGIFVWLMLYRFLHWRFPQQGEFPLGVIASTWFLVGALTFLLEAAGFWIAFGADPLRVLVADFTFQAGIRPGWYVWGAGAIVTAIGIVRIKPAAGGFQLSASNPGRTPS